MPLTTRTAITAFDDVRHAARQSAPDAATVLVAWSRAHMSVAAVGLLDDDGRPLDPKPELLAMLTALFPVPVDEDLLRLAYPETLQAFAQGELPAAERVDGMTDGSGQLLFQIPRRRAGVGTRHRQRPRTCAGRAVGAGRGHPRRTVVGAVRARAPRRGRSSSPGRGRTVVPGRAVVHAGGADRGTRRSIGP